MLRHSRLHHRRTHQHHQQRRLRLAHTLWFWVTPPWELRDVDTHFPSHLLGKKTAFDRHHEQRVFRQTVRNALAHNDPIPRFRKDWAD